MRLLAIGIHPDDAELGCGGSVALAAGRGHDVVLVDLSAGASSSNGTPEERLVEANAAARILGAKERINLGLPDTAIQSENLDQLEAVVRILRDVQPDEVLLPSARDPHPDHDSGARLCRRALYLSGVHGFLPASPPWQVKIAFTYAGRLEIEPHVVVDISTVYDKKIRAVRAHESQFIFTEGRKPTRLNSPEFFPFLEARHRVYGHRVGVRHGEPFRLVKPLALKDIAALGA